MRPIKSAILAAGGAAAMVLLAGCSPTEGSVNPVDWWHALEGGRIAEQRPPPPNADAPYPNLSSVPARPVPTDAATRGRIATGLLADRADAAYAGAAMPELSVPRTPSPAPAAASPDDSPSASLAAASTPPAGAPRRASRVESPPLVPLTAAAPAGEDAGQNGAAMDVAAASMPAAPPRAPHIQGVDVPATTVPTPPPVAPPTPPPVPKATVTATSVLVPFQPGNAEITPETQDALRTLALHRGAAPMDAIGYGDAPGGDPAAQSAALPLALARARAIVAVLTISGVPAALVRFQAEAEGRGGVARIAN